MNVRNIFAAGALAISTVTGGGAQAGFTIASTDCATLNATPLSWSNANLDITVSAGQTVSWVPEAGGGTFNLTAGFLGPVVASGNSGSYTALSGDTLLFLIYISGDVTVTVSCALASASSGATGGSAGTLGASAQTGATFAGVTNNGDARFGNGGAQVSSNRVFVSTAGDNTGLVSPDWNAWASVSGRNFNGATSGNSADIVAGIDRMVGPSTLAGVLLGYGTISVTDGVTPASATSPMIGAYFSTRQSGLNSDGFVSVATPQTTTNGATFSGSRQAGGLSVSKDLQQGNTTVRLIGKVSGYTEAQPSYVTGSSVTIAANTISKMVASVGVRLTFENAAWAGGFTPYLSGHAEYSVISETATGVVTFASPRFGLGLSGPLGGGTLSLAIDAGRALASTVDTGIKLRYDLRF